MTVDFLRGGVGNIVGSAVIVLCGLLVLLPRPRTRAQRYFTAFACGIGASTAGTNLTFSNPDWPNNLIWMGLAVGHVVALAGLIGVVASTTGRPTRRQQVLILATGLVLSTILLAGYLDPTNLRPAFEAAHFSWADAQPAATFVATWLFAGCWAASTALALWARGQDAAGQSQAALLASSFVVYPIVIGTTGTGLDFWLWRMLAVGTMVAAAWNSVLWLSVARRGPARRAATLAALFPIAVVIVGMSLGITTGFPTAGVSRIVTTALVAYAILRHHALGIDAKLRFGISKSVVAAVFVGVFFAASELAQQFFGQQSGNAYIGIAAAGLLVVAIAPLQRLADRLAEKAVPIRNPVGNHTLQEEIYREAVQAASRDGVVTRREEVHLARIADRLGIGVERALQLRGPAAGKNRGNR